MKTETKATVLEALRTARFVAEHEEIYGNPNQLARIDASIAAIEAGDGEAWEPDENGLLPCPFCGEKVELFLPGAFSGEEFDGAEVFCECKATGHNHETIEEAIAAWNRRTTAPQPANPDTRLICDECNDYLEHPAYCEQCFGTMKQAALEGMAQQPAREPLWPDKRIDDELGIIEDGLDRGEYMPWRVEPLLQKMRDEYEAERHTAQQPAPTASVPSEDAIGFVRGLLYQEKSRLELLQEEWDWVGRRRGLALLSEFETWLNEQEGESNA